MSSSHNRNPQGNNQHGPAPKWDDPVFAAALRSYHRQGISSNSLIKQRLFAEHNIGVSVAHIKRARTRLELFGPRSKLQGLTDQEKEQIVLQQLDKDPSKGQGRGRIKNNVAHDQGIHLSRDTVSKIMHVHDPDGFNNRIPGGKKVFRVAKAPIGIHERWAGDGHDKLYRIGFPIWAVVDDATGRWLGAWVAPSNRLGVIIGYLFLCIVIKFKGLPLQFSTDCGSETTQLYGLVNALREIFHPEYDRTQLPAHCYLRSVHNISIERSWLQMRATFGDNAVKSYEGGLQHVSYDAEDPLHAQLCQWVWSRAIQNGLEACMETHNSLKMRKDKHKVGPSGCSRNDAFFLHNNYGLQNCLLPLTDDQLKVVAEIQEFMGGESLLAFTSPEFSDKAEKAYQSLHITELDIHNAWHVFKALLPLLRVE